MAGSEEPTGSGVPGALADKEGYRDWLTRYHRYVQSDLMEEMARVGPMRREAWNLAGEDLYPSLPECEGVAKTMLSDVADFVMRSRWVHLRLSTERVIREIPVAGEWRETITGILGYGHDHCGSAGWTDMQAALEVLLTRHSPYTQVMPRVGVMAQQVDEEGRAFTGYREVYLATLDLVMNATGFYEMLRSCPEELERETPRTSWMRNPYVGDRFRRFREITLNG